MKRRILFTMVFLFLCGRDAFPKSLQTAMRTCKGTGTTLQKAIVACLGVAIYKEEGIAAKNKWFVRAVNLSTHNDNNGSYLTAKAYQRRVSSVSKGIVAGYAIKAVHHTTPSLYQNLRIALYKLFGQPVRTKPEVWTAQMLVRFNQFNDFSNENHMRLAVFPFRVSNSKFGLFGQRISRSEVAHRITIDVQSYLVSTHDFTILNWRPSAQAQEELQQIELGNAPVKDEVLLGHMLVADYVLVGRIRHFDYVMDRQHSMTGKHVFITARGSMNASYRLISVPTGQIVASSSRQVSFSRFLPFGGVLPSSSVFHGQLSELSQEIARSIVQHVYPIRILAFQHGLYVIGAGRGIVSIGESFSIMQNGPKLLNPYSHRSLGNAKTYCCRILLKRVTQRLAYGVLIPPTKKLGGSLRSYVLGHQIRTAVTGQAASSTTSLKAIESIIHRQDNKAHLHGEEEP